jgi:aspartyl-tRNA(Asn)/glutamyl-tRNA(Gln) amidotransferase subunit A
VDETPWPTVVELADAVRRGERSAVEATETALAAIEAGNERIGAFVTVDPELALAAARQVDEVVAHGGDPGPLAGVPFGVKDLEDCAGLPTSHGSLLRRGDPPATEDSLHVGRLRAAGAVPVGKTATPEFGTLNFTKTKAFGIARNPWDHGRTPGGSSGGSAAAVAAGLVPMATGSDGGGSIRIPAAFTGLVGHKSSFGRIPHPGPDGSLTTVLGILATTVGDAARHLDVSAGPDARDRRSLPAPGGSYERAAGELDVDGLRARWSADLGFAVVDPEVAEIAEAAAEALSAAAGLALDGDPVQLTDPVRAWLSSGALDLWFSVEAEEWPSRADDVTRYVRTVLEQTEMMTVPRLAQAEKRRAQVELDAAALFADVDVVLTPTTAVPAFAAAGPPPPEIAGRRVTAAMSTPFTMLANLCWNPSISVPAGVTADGLPVGLMITAGQHRDDLCLRLARVLEEIRPWPRWAPAEAAQPS